MSTASPIDSSELADSSPLGPEAAGIFLTPEEFDHANFEPGWRYELLQGVLVVSPSTLRQERDPNEELGYWLRHYAKEHAQGSHLRLTLAEETVSTGENRRRVDRAIWTGPGGLPAHDEFPGIVVEFVSAGRRNRERDYRIKRAEYRAAGAQEYWIFDRFKRTMTTIHFTVRGEEIVVKQASQSFTTPMLPGFELQLPELFLLMDRWPENSDAE